MKIEWTDKAIWDALRAIGWSDEARNRDYMRAALDAAMTAHGCPKLPDCKTYADRAYAAGHAEAFKEAAALAERLAPDLPDIADALRKLAERDAEGKTP